MLLPDLRKNYPMELKRLDNELTVCKVASADDVDLSGELVFVGKTDEEVSLVCETCNVPAGAIAREDGWRCFRIQGVLDFSLVGILAKIADVLADEGIGIFAVSTFNTDYILVKEGIFDRALDALAAAGYEVV